jgi:CubicO group peptidase (beta-lactamase class C family)
MQSAVAAHEVSGAVTVVVTWKRVVHLEATGLANITRKEPTRPDPLFWIASMTKPVTAVAVLMLQDDGKLNVEDPIARYIPAFASLKTPTGQSANLTIAQVLTHTRGFADILMVQRSNFPNSDASDIRRAFQQAAADALAK